MAMRLGPAGQAWAAFLLSSALIVATLVPMIRFGFVFFYFPVILIFGCDSATSRSDCNGILMRSFLIPLVPPALTAVSLVWCRIALASKRFSSSVAGAAVACALSWVVTQQGFH